MSTFTEILLCFLVSLVCHQLFQLLKRLSMHSPGQLAFALTCGAVAWMLLWRQKKAVMEAGKRRNERKNQLNGREKRPLPPTSRRKSNTDSNFSNRESPLSASKLKSIPTPKGETFSTRTARPLRSTIKQQSTSFRLASVGRIEKAVPIFQDHRTPERSVGGQDTSSAQSKPQSAPHAPFHEAIFAPKAALAPQITSERTSMKSSPFQAISETGYKQNSVVRCRRSSNFECSPEADAQLRQLNPGEASPETIYNAIYACLNESGIAQPSPFHIHLSLSLLEHEPGQEFYEYLNLRQAEQLREDGPEEKDSPGHCRHRPASGPEETNGKEYREKFIPLMSGAVQPADSYILDPRTRRRPERNIPDNDSTVCDESLGFDQQLQLQPFRLVSKRDLVHVWPFEPRHCLQYIPDEYHTTNLGLSIIVRKVREAKEWVEAVLPFVSTDFDRVSILNEYDLQVVQWLYRLGGHFDPSQKTYLERGLVRYAEDLIPYSDDEPEFRAWMDEEEQYWSALWNRAMQFWSSVGFHGEYDRYGYIPENDSEGSKIWQAHLIWERDRNKGRVPRMIFTGESKTG